RADPNRRGCGPARRPRAGRAACRTAPRPRRARPGTAASSRRRRCRGSWPASAPRRPAYPAMWGHVAISPHRATTVDVGPAGVRPCGDFPTSEHITPQRVVVLDWRMRVVLADDSVLLREGMARLLEDSGFEVVGQAGDAEELMLKVRSYSPAVALVDIR